MKRQMIYIAVITGAVFAPCASGAATRIDLTEEMKDSIVFLETSAYGYDLSEPWKHKGLSQNWACACAVGEYEVLTTAENVVNLAFAKALRYGQNEFVGAKLVVVDYRSNLCLIAGALSSALLAGQFRLQRPPLVEYLRAVFGGVLMGLGAVLAGGCTVGGFFTPVLFSSAAGWAMCVRRRIRLVRWRSESRCARRRRLRRPQELLDRRP